MLAQGAQKTTGVKSILRGKKKMPFCIGAALHICSFRFRELQKGSLLTPLRSGGGLTLSVLMSNVEMTLQGNQPLEHKG